MKTKNLLAILAMLLFTATAATAQTTADRHWEYSMDYRLYAINNDEFPPAFSITGGAHYRLCPQIWIGASAGIECMTELIFNSYATLPVMANLHIYPFRGRLSHLGLYGNAGYHFYLGNIKLFDWDLDIDRSHGVMADYGLIWKKRVNTKWGYTFRAGYSFRQFDFHDGDESLYRRCLTLGAGVIF